MAEKQAQGATTKQKTKYYLDAALEATRSADKDRTAEQIAALAAVATNGKVTYTKNVRKTIDLNIELIDRMIEKQLREVIHHPRFLELEGRWRGLQHLVKASGAAEDIKISFLDVPKDMLLEDLQEAEEFDQSETFKKIYDAEYGQSGGAPFGALIGDYEFSNTPDDVDLLKKLSPVCAAAFAPFIAGAAPGMFGQKSFDQVMARKSIKEIFDGDEYASWSSFRESKDSRFVSLVMPRVLARLPYGGKQKPARGLDFEEGPYKEINDSDDVKREYFELEHEHYCWMNAAYAMGGIMAEAYARSGLCTGMRGELGGGLLRDLPIHTVRTSEGDMRNKCPTETLINSRREKEFSDAGFMSFIHEKGTDKATLDSGQTTQKPAKYVGNPAANASAELSARLLNVMTISRFSHCLQIMGRKLIGTYKDKGQVEKELTDWIFTFVNQAEGGDQATRERYPLKNAKISVVEIEGRPGYFQAVADLEPWVPLEGLQTTFRTVAGFSDS